MVYVVSERNSLTQEASLDEVANLRKHILRVKGDAVRQFLKVSATGIINPKAFPTGSTHGGCWNKT